ncbi:family 43 glycosylhydrolase [Butyrivibrio sp. XPD2002]|uniref:family 43 glycosylhydrolase n=1 Tax=Butyrivibrio sp. XPD2002 TaxID=1280665 RepID=UPI00041AB410|nr:family 43 glycosylhydrolase [Butyrivibrio sp. XPD2002]
MWKGKNRWLAVALSAAMTVTAVPAGGLQVRAEANTDTEELAVTADDSAVTDGNTGDEKEGEEVDEADKDSESAAADNDTEDKSTEDDKEKTDEAEKTEKDAAPEEKEVSRILYMSFDESISDDSGKGSIIKAYSYDSEDGNLTVTSDEKIIGSGALKLQKDKGQWLDIKDAEGKNILSGLENITINYFSKTNYNTTSNWSFFAAPSADGQGWMWEKYLGVIDTKKNDNVIDVERYYSNGQARPVTTWTPYTENDWKMVTVVANADSVKLYVNGERKKVENSEVALSDIFAENGILQIGKGNWDGGQYSDLFLDEYSIYDGALSEDDVKDIYESYKGMIVEEPETPEEEDPGVEEIGDSNLVLHFTFDSEEKGFTGRGAKATSYGGYQLVENGENEGVGKKAIKLGKDQWLDVKSVDGEKNVLSGLETVTINFFSKALSSGTSWAFFAAPNTNQQSWQSEKYLGITDPLENKSISVERYYSNNQPRPAAASTGKVSGMKMVTVVATKNSTYLYIDGKVKGCVDSTVSLKDIFGGDNGILQIGKANWGNGEYSEMIMDDLAVFNRALSEKEIVALYESKDVEAVEYKEYSEEDEEKEPVKDLGIRVTEVEANYTESLAVTPGEDYSFLENTGAKITFNNGETKEDAVIAWFDKDGNRVINAKDLSVGTHELTGKLTYFGSPVAEQKADPYVVYNDADGYYYMTSSWPAYGDENHGYDRVALRRSKTLAGLAEAEDVTVWNAHENGELQYHIWAPELHKIGSDWYVYFAGSCDGNKWSIRPYVLHCTDSNDLLNPEKWEEKGRFVNKDGNEKGAFDAFTLDMTMFTSGAKSYVIWAYKNGASVLKMAELNTEEPWKLASDPVTISEPMYSWEMNGSEKINEGPAVLKKDGKIYVAFSGSTTGPEYCMGLLTADENSDLMDPDSWKKSKYAALKTEDLVGQYGPGHNSFTVDKDGNIIVVYHARDEKCYKEQCEWHDKDPLYDPCRNAHMAILRFDEDGRPVFASTEEVEMQNLSDEQKTFKMTVTVGSSKDALEADAKAITIPNANDVRGNITLPEKGENGSEITWKSSAPQIVSDEDNGSIKKGVVNRTDKDEKVTLTATLTIGSETVERDIELTVKAKVAEKNLTHYLFAYFTGENTANGEQIYFADSEDGLNWSALNVGDPVITSTLGEKGLRDPFIIRSPEGDKFYLIATDLKINNGRGWGLAQTDGSKSIMVWESTDLVNWGEQRMVKVADDAAGCTWAPEAFYDDETGEYIVFWASMIDNYHKVWYATTRDFYTFSEPKVWIHLKNKNGENISVIDTSVIAVDNADGTKTYYRISKDEAGSHAAVAEGDPDSGKFEILETASSLTGEWTRIPSSFLNENQWVEGGTIFKFNNENKWCMLLDNFGGGGYYPCLTTDIGSGSFTRVEKGEYSFPSTMRHGTVIGITDEEYKAIEKKWAYDDSDVTYPTSLAEAAIAHFTFDDEETGFAGNGAVATPGESGYDVADRDGNKAIKLDRKSKQYLTLTNEDGSSLLSGLDELTVNYWSNTEVKNETQWLFYAAGSSDAPQNNNEHYLGIIDPLTNDKLLHVERYDNHGSRSTNNAADIGRYSNKWKMVTVVFMKDMTKLYVNGKLVSAVNSDVVISDILGENGITQIGKANWGGGEYTTAMIDEYSIFDRPINSAEVMKLYNGEVDFDKTPANTDPEPQPEPAPQPGDTPEEKPEEESNVKPEDKPANQETQPESKPETVTSDEPAGGSAVKEDTTVVTGKVSKIKKGKNKGKYKLVLDDGSTVKGLVKLNGKLYYFNSKGIAKKGFHKVDGKKYYTNAKGKVLTGLRMIKGKLYYFDKSGVMQTGKVKIGKLTYLFGKNGKLKKISIGKKK